MSSITRDSLDVLVAIDTAKAYISEVYSGESIVNMGLEEVRFDQESGSWLITVGFARPWDRQLFDEARLLSKAVNYRLLDDRTYKIVHIAAVDGRVIKMANHPTLGPVLPGV